MDWITGIQNAIDYIEQNLTQPLDMEEIAKRSCASSFHFQRVFHVLSGYTLGEYIRFRRLSQAGIALAEGKRKVIDVALDYGHETPESFAKAFSKFHGINPSQARGHGAELRVFTPLSIKLSLEGGDIMNYRIEEKPAMLLTGYKRRMHGDPGDRQMQDHNFACESRLYQLILEGASREHETIYEVMTNFDPDGYDFYYAYQLPGWALEDFDEDVGELRSAFTHLHIPAGKYLVCETERSQYPCDLEEELRKRAVGQWLPGSGYVMRDAPEINVIHWFWEEGNEERNNSRYSELWLPIQKTE